MTRDQIIEMLEDIIGVADSDGLYKSLSEWSDEHIDPLVAIVEEHLERQEGLVG